MTEPHGVAAAVTSRMCQRTAGAFPPVFLLPGPTPFSSSWPCLLGTLPSHPPAATQPPKPRPPCLSQCWLRQHQLGARADKPSKDPDIGSLPPFPLLSAVSVPHWSFGETSVFLIYCRTHRRGPNSHLLMAAAALSTFCEGEAGLVD